MVRNDSNRDPDSLMSRMTFKLGTLREDPSFRDVDDAFLRVGGDLSLMVDGRCIYQEEGVPVVELANQLHRWVSIGLEQTRTSPMTRWSLMALLSSGSVVQGPP